MSSWNCPHEQGGRCNKVARALCRPGMKGCVLVGKVKFQDGVVPEPVWPEAESGPNLGEPARASGLGPQASGSLRGLKPEA